MAADLPQPVVTLASASPRRRELLAYLGLPFAVTANSGEELPLAPSANLRDRLPPLELPPQEHPTLLAWRKAVVALADHAGPVLAADTIVVLEDAVLGKPRDPAHARAMLRRLAGRAHDVYTGLVLLDRGRPDLLLVDLVHARVELAQLTDQQIAAYVATGEPLDKAGAYGIQGLGGDLVTAVTGSYTAVVGLPLPATARLLTAAGLQPPVSAAHAFARWSATLRKEPPPCSA